IEGCVASNLELIGMIKNPTESLARVENTICDVVDDGKPGDYEANSAK
ncbi:hypothetical protein AVEN_183116-1, partial [Araneus ventricosus]